MANAMIAMLPDRGIVSITGADAERLLQGLLTNDIGGLSAGAAKHAALLSPQGKILFDFFVVRTDVGFLLDVVAEKADDLVKRLQLYKLRANAVLRNDSTAHRVFAAWDGESLPLPDAKNSVSFADPRHPAMGVRVITVADDARPVAPSADYDAHRVELGVPDGGKDYAFGDTYPHEANLDLLDGVSFSKGCYVGQEVVARMQHKAIVRKRIVRVSGNARLSSGMDILLKDIPIGKIGTVSGCHALAMLRLDRAAEAEVEHVQLTAGSVPIVADSAALARYRDAVAARPESARLPP